MLGIDVRLVKIGIIISTHPSPLTPPTSTCTCTCLRNRGACLTVWLLCCLANWLSGCCAVLLSLGHLGPQCHCHASLLFCRSISQPLYLCLSVFCVCVGVCLCSLVASLRVDLAKCEDLGDANMVVTTVATWSKVKRSVLARCLHAVRVLLDRFQGM